MSRLDTRWRRVLLLTALAAVIGMASPAAISAEPEVTVVADRAGQKLVVDNEDYMVFGMNWGYMPIGENYMYNLWAQPDDIIETVLAREMSLLQDMGVNSIRQYVGIPPRWVEYIYDNYGITTMVNHTVGRYGYTIDGAWVPSVDYSDPRFRELVTAEVIEWTEMYRDTRGVLMWLLGNENNYGLHWSSFEIEALPLEQRNEARARYLYTLYEDIMREMKRVDPDRPLAICNGDLQYIDIIAEQCGTMDVLGTNVYRGISARDLYEEVAKKLGVPVVYTEFGADAYNAKDMREDQIMQARYLIGQWQEIYEQSYGKGRVGNAIGGYIFQWSDGWWKYLQESRLDIHDTNASWPNGGYIEDFVEGENNMNEEWWGITAKAPPDHRGLYEVYPRAAYYALKRAFELAPYDRATDLEAIREHFGAITPAAAALEARGDRAALLVSPRDRVHVSGLRLRFETINTGGTHTTTPKVEGAGEGYPSFMGFDQMQSFYVDFEARPAENVSGRLSLSILGNVPENPINEIFYENRGRPRTFLTEDGETEVEDLERLRIYQASMSWDDKWFTLDGFYRTGHLHWKYEGDFFGLYRDAYYGENVDIYNGTAPVGFEVTGKKAFEGLKVAYGPQLWWGANPAVLVKYQRTVPEGTATVIYHEDVSEQSAVNTSIAIPEPKTRKVSIQYETSRDAWTFEGGVLWSGQTKVGREFQVAKETSDGYVMLQDTIKDTKGDVFGGKAKVTWESGPWHWYAQAARMGLVADAGPDPVITFTGWKLKDSGSGNQTNFLTGLAANVGDFQIAPNFLWQKPLVGPIPSDVPSPGRPRNVLSDPFAVRANREMVGGEIIITYDPTPASWFWQWDNAAREDAGLAASLGFMYMHLPTTTDVGNFIAEDGVTVYSFPASPPAEDLWVLDARIVSKLGPRTRLVSTFMYGRAQPNGYDPTGADETLNRVIDAYGTTARITHGPLAVEAAAYFNGWGPYDYHRDFNLTYPVQVMGGASYSLGSPGWLFGQAHTRIGFSGTWRALDANSNRYDAESAGDDTGSEWEFRTYLEVGI